MLRVQVMCLKAAYTRESTVVHVLLGGSAGHARHLEVYDHALTEENTIAIL
jgi:hypothetical protein